jgi:hypothetical protein
LILVPLIDLKFLIELAAGDAGTSNRRHSTGIAITQNMGPRGAAFHG